MPDKPGLALRKKQMQESLSHKLNRDIDVMSAWDDYLKRTAGLGPMNGMDISSMPEYHKINEAQAYQTHANRGVDVSRTALARQEAVPRPGLVQREREYEAAVEAERMANRKRSLLPFDVPDPVVGPTNPEGQRTAQARRALIRQLLVAQKLSSTGTMPFSKYSEGGGGPYARK